MLTDTHAHLTFPQLAEDIDAVIGRAADRGVRRIVTIGTDLASSEAALRLTDRFPGVVFAAVGIHPCDSADFDEADLDRSIARLRELAGHPAAIAIGEIGLDFYHPAPEPLDEAAYRSRQSVYFRAQLELAADLGMNAVIHQRGGSGPEILRMMEPFHDKLRAVFHCFTDRWDAARPLIERGHLVSFTGIVTFPKAADAKDCAANAPDGSFMVETDSPFLAPVPHRGKRCEPAFVRDTAEHIAVLRGAAIEDLAAITEQTADAFLFQR